MRSHRIIHKPCRLFIIIYSILSKIIYILKNSILQGEAKSQGSVSHSLAKLSNNEDYFSNASAFQMKGSNAATEASKLSTRRALRLKGHILLDTLK